MQKTMQLKAWADALGERRFAQPQITGAVTRVKLCHRGRPVITASNDYDVALQYIALLDAPARSHWKIGDAPKNRRP